MKNKKSLKQKQKDKINNKAWYQANREHSLQQAKKYQELNKEKVQAYQREYRKKRYAEDPQYRIAQTLRARLNGALKNKQKTGSAIKDLRCSVEFLMKHLESKFVDGMTWDNYGEWEIDHIIPVSQFDLSNREELLKACNYTNLQPLWEKDNIRKSNGTII